MKTLTLIFSALILIAINSFAQGGWTICNAPPLGNRVDDIFMVDTQTGYAVCGDLILKTIDGGTNWSTVRRDTTVHCRSVEFINSQKGFVGALDQIDPIDNTLRMTTDGGLSWTNCTPLIDSRARKGICGLAIPDSNTIYGCGNWFQDSAYIVKSIDGGSSWNFIDMHLYATSLIDMYFLNKDTGFATGKGPLPLEAAVILYTADGGQSWSYKFQDTANSAYCWKIQHLTDRIYYASIEDYNSSIVARILKSSDGGMTWNMLVVPYVLNGNGIQGVGFIDTLNGWTGGGIWPTIVTSDGGATWDTTFICPAINRVFKVNDTLLFASGWDIWKYNSLSTGVALVPEAQTEQSSINCYPNPANKNLNIDITLLQSTHALLVLLDESGRRIKTIENVAKPKGTLQYQLNTENLNEGVYYIVLKTHEDQAIKKVIVRH